MQDANKDLTDKQLKFIDLYFKLNDIQQICKELNIKRATYYSYLNNELVKAEIDKIRAELLSNTTTFLQSNLKTCSDELMQIITNKETQPQIKISAINSVFNNCSKLTEQIDIITKIDAIEQRLSEQEDKNNDKQ
jgi:hypothetical protein